MNVESVSFFIKYKMSNVCVLCCVRKYEVYIFCTKEDIENKNKPTIAILFHLSYKQAR